MLVLVRCWANILLGPFGFPMAPTPKIKETCSLRERAIQRCVMLQAGDLNHGPIRLLVQGFSEGRITAFEGISGDTCVCVCVRLF